MVRKHRSERVEKPPYRVPTMAEVAEARGTNGYDVVSLFAGGGGSSTGYEMAGFRVVWANEFLPHAREVYAANHPETILDDRDIRTIEPEEILEAIGKEPGELDVLDGSPPCDPFSTAGKGSKSWGKKKSYYGGKKRQRTDDLFFEYIRILEGIRPRCFVAENVAGLVKGKAKGYFLEILAALKATGYHAEARVLDAQWLGVPQTRARLIFQGAAAAEIRWPRPALTRVTIREAIHGCDGGTRQRLSQRMARWYYQTKPGDTLDKGRARIERDGKHSAFTHRRLSWDKPAGALQGPQGACQGAYHPEMAASLTLPEMRRIASFPDDYAIPPEVAERDMWAVFGMSVPPLMMRAIAEKVREALDAEEAV